MCARVCMRVWEVYRVPWLQMSFPLYTLGPFHGSTSLDHPRNCTDKRQRLGTCLLWGDNAQVALKLAPWAQAASPGRGKARCQAPHPPASPCAPSTGSAGPRWDQIREAGGSSSPPGRCSGSRRSGSQSILEAKVDSDVGQRTPSWGLSSLKYATN